MEATIHVYLKGGCIITYEIQALTNDQLAAKAREHCYAVSSSGIRCNDGDGDFVHYGPHWIDKVKVTGVRVPTNYPTTLKGT